MVRLLLKRKFDFPFKDVLYNHVLVKLNQLDLSVTEKGERYDLTYKKMRYFLDKDYEQMNGISISRLLKYCFIEKIPLIIDGKKIVTVNEIETFLTTIIKQRIDNLELNNTEVANLLGTNRQFISSFMNNNYTSLKTVGLDKLFYLAHKLQIDSILK